jgi:hypothetical protein
MRSLSFEEELVMVLRISRDDGRAHGVTLKIDGRLVGAWAALLEHECYDAMREAAEVSVDLSGVAVIDRAAIDALGRLDDAGVAIRGCSDLVRSILAAEGIRADGCLQ